MGRSAFLLRATVVASCKELQSTHCKYLRTSLRISVQAGLLPVGEGGAVPVWGVQYFCPKILCMFAQRSIYFPPKQQIFCLKEMTPASISCTCFLVQKNFHLGSELFINVRLLLFCFQTWTFIRTRTFICCPGKEQFPCQTVVPQCFVSTRQFEMKQMQEIRRAVQGKIGYEISRNRKLVFILCVMSCT